MKKIKVLITGIVMIGTILVAGLAHANPTNVTVTFDVESVTGISGCSSIDLGLFGVNQGKDSSSAPCNITAYSNDPDGFIITVHGSNTGFFDGGSFEWDKLNISTGAMDTSCTSGCTEAWGFRIATGTASEYDTVEGDVNNEAKGFDEDTCGTSGLDKCWHTVNYDSVGLPGYVGAETIITNTGPTSDDTANFDLEVGAVSGATSAGDYNDQITITLITQ